MYKSFVTLGRYIPKYFILFVAMVNGIVFLISLSFFFFHCYRSFVSLGRYIPKYFILFVALVNGIVSLISLSVFFFHCYCIGMQGISVC